MAKQSRRRQNRRGSATAAATAAGAVAVVLALSASQPRCKSSSRVGRPTASVDAFAPTPALLAGSSRYGVRRYMSDVGGGLGDRPPSGGGTGGNSGAGGNGPGKRNMDDFLGRDDGESENIRAAREQISEDSLPVSFGFRKENGTEQKDSDTQERIAADGVTDDDDTKVAEKGGELARKPEDSAAAALDLKDNPYLEVVSRLSPSDLISKFTTTAHPRVQDAVRSTILGLIGNLPKMAFDTTTITTGERLASLMFQLQMTGYMFKNAEYRLSLAQSLGMDHMPTAEGMAKSGYLLEGTLRPHRDEDNEDSPIKLDGEIKGKIRVKYSGSASKSTSSDAASDGDETVNADAKVKEETEGVDDDTAASGIGGMEIEVDAAAYMSELRDEVSQLKEELTATRKTKDEAIKKDLLLYIRTMPREELSSLTGTISPDVLAAMKGLVNVVMAGIGEGRIEPDTITEQSGEAMAQLCMWQLVVGYNLRELEVREEMRAALGSSPLKGDGQDEDGRIWYGSG